MSLQAEIEALRSASGCSRLAHVAALRLEGPDAFAVLDLVSTRPLFLREGQLCHTLFLREDAGLFADVFVCFGEDAFYVLAEGPSEAELLAYVRAAQARELPEANASVEGLSSSFELIGIDGPYAWEVVAELLGPAVLSSALPFAGTARRVLKTVKLQFEGRSLRDLPIKAIYNGERPLCGHTSAGVLVYYER